LASGDRRLSAWRAVQLRALFELVMKACRRVCGPTGLVIPAWRATRRTIRPAPRLP